MALRYQSLTEMNEALARSRPKLTDEFAIKPTKPAPTVKVKKRRKVIEMPAVAEKPVEQLEIPAVPLIQRPNAVPKDGGPQLLRGLMLPIPPSVNHYWDYRLMRPKHGGRAMPMKYTTAKGKAYQKHIAEIALERGFRFLTTKRLRMDVVVCFADRRTSDLDNRLKVLLDSMMRAEVFDDDGQIDDLRIRRGPLMAGGRVIVSLWEISHDANVVLTEAWR